MQSNPRRKKNSRRLVVTFDLHNGVFILNAFSFEKKTFYPCQCHHSSLPIANIRIQPPTLPQLPLTTRRQIGTYGALSFLSLARSLSFLITRTIIWVSLSLYSQLFFYPPMRSLSLSLVRCVFFSLAFICPNQSKG